MENTKKQRVVGIPWKKGQSGNPSGRPKESNIRKITQSYVESLIDKFTDISVEDLKAFTKDDKANSFERAIAQAVYNSLVAGDFGTLDQILGRRIGKVKTVVEVTGKDGGPMHNNVTNLTDEQLLAEASRIRQLREGKVE
jgi:hypothetical protein